jgi:hypothetical protein
MSRVRVYLQTFDDDGVYTGTWSEITNDVREAGVSAITQSLDMTEFDIGVIRNSSIDLKLRNDHGRYSDVGNIDSVFRYTRANSLVKVTWNRADRDVPPRLLRPGIDFISQEEECYIGLLNDDSAKMGLVDHEVSFRVLGRESVLDQVAVPAGLVNGDTVSEILLHILNQSRVTNLLTVSALNLNPGLDSAWDDVSVFENQTVREALPDLLLASNSVLYIEGDAIVVSSRAPGETVAMEFYGQGTVNGRENILNVKDITSGRARILNYVRWQDTSLLETDASSVTRNGIRTRDPIDIEGITTQATREAILESIRDEFANPKREFTLVTPLTYESLELALLDRVSIDYPHVSIDPNDPMYGFAEYEVALYPQPLTNFEILPEDGFKIIAKKTDLLKEEVELHLREI